MQQMQRTQYAVTRVNNLGAVIELCDVDTKQVLSIVNHPKLQHIREYLSSGLGVLEWNTERHDPDTRWINAVYCLDQPYWAIDIHGPWNNALATTLPSNDFEVVATLNESWWVPPQVERDIKW